MWTDNPVFKEDLDRIVSFKYIPWDDLNNKTVFVTGATGLIGYTVVSALLRYNQLHNAGIKVVALVRDINKVGIKFNKQLSEDCDLTFIRGSVEYLPEIVGSIDYIIHGACPTSSNFFVEHAVETINAIVAGTKNILELARKKDVSGVVFLSSMEVFGKIPERKELSESDLGYIDLFSPRSGYPEGKRFAENMCCAYANQYGVPVTAARLAQTFGPGVSGDDERVFAYMARCALNGEDIRLNTDGSKENMYLYTADAVGAILLLLVNGERGTAYNVGNPETYCSVKEMAQTVATSLGKNKISVMTNCGASKIYPPNSYLKMDVSKLKFAGWFASVSLSQMFERMVACFDEEEEYENGLKPRGEVYAQTASDYDAILAQLQYLNERLTNSELSVNKRFNKTDAALKRINSKTDKTSVKFKRKIKNIAKRETLFGHFIKGLLNVHHSIKLFNFRTEFKKLPVQENKVFAITFDKRYNCNAKYIVQEMLRQQLPLDIVWVIPASGIIKRSDYPEGVRLVKYGCKEMYMEMSTSKVWIDNALNCVWDNGMKKKPGQVYINTWHGSMGIKKLGGDKHWMSRANLCNKATDYCISNCKFEEDVYRETFWKDVPYLRLGHARNDILLKKDLRGLRKQICARYKITPNKKILLYAPTFRDDGRLDWCDLDFNGLRDILSEKFGGDWVVFIRKHFKNRTKNVTDVELNDCIIDVTDYIDMQELLAVADAGITDYSSWAFDYVLTGRPLFIYATDLDQYDQVRGFYYPLEETPFPIAKSKEELDTNIRSFDDESYQIKVDEFLKGKECMDDGHASERIVDLIKEVTNTKMQPNGKNADS